MVWNLHTQKHTITNTRRDRRENSAFGERIAGSSQWRKRHPFGQLFWFFRYDQQLQLPASIARNSMLESFLGNPLTLIKLWAGRRSFTCTTHRTVSSSRRRRRPPLPSPPLLVLVIIIIVIIICCWRECRRDDEDDNRSATQGRLLLWPLSQKCIPREPRD